MKTVKLILCIAAQMILIVPHIAFERQCFKIEDFPSPQTLDKNFSELGVSASYSGQSGEFFVVAGGANFPGIPASDGGKKVFYDDIVLLRQDSDSLVWEACGSLPEASAYGASASLGSSLFIAGGTCEAGSLRAVYEIVPDADGVRVEVRPCLPVPVEQASMSCAAGILYIAGGLSGDNPNLKVFSMPADASAGAGWSEIAELPEPLVQPVTFAVDSGLYVWGGYNLEKRKAVGYGYFLDFSDGLWRKFTFPGRRTFTGAAQAAGNDGRLYVTGGVDRKIFSSALSMSISDFKDYMLQPAEYYRFCDGLWEFDPATGKWSLAGRSDKLARAGAASGFFNGRMIIYGGELKPGIRTPSACLVSL